MCEVPITNRKRTKEKNCGQFPVGVNNPQLANWHQEAQNIDHQIILSVHFIFTSQSEW